MDNTQEIFYKMLKGDERALSNLLDQYHNYLIVVGMRYLTDKQRVEDVIHDVFADLWNNKRDINITAGVKSFFRGAVVNKCLAIIRKDSRMDYVESHSYDMAENSPSADQLIDRDNLQEIINKTIESLPEKCKAVFKLSRYQGKSHKEISEELNISKKTIENHMTKALKTLREQLKRKELLIILFIIIKIKFLLGGNHYL